MAFSRFAARTLAPLLAGALLLAPSPGAAATDEEKAGARAAAVEGVKAYGEQRWADVVDMFGRAEALVHSPMHQLYIGRANLKLGKLVLAREALLRASRERVEADSPPAFQRAKDEAAAELAALEPRIPYLTLKLEGGTPAAVTVTMDGVKVPAPLIGVPRPVDPGEHRIEASGAGVSGQPVVVTVGEGERKSAALVVTVVAAPAATAGPSPAAGGEAPAASPTPGEGPDRGGEGGTNALRLASYGALGVGVVGLGMGSIFGLRAISERGKADDLCKGGCLESQRDQVEKHDEAATSANTLAVVGFALGGVGLAAGGALWFLSADDEPATTAGVTPFVGFGSAGVSGRF